ncbi:MAG: phosphate signaling complex protein PhoU [Treponema sp.]|jgi:phosphate transport system protein|nr:phosphate signaling complex protein PhoU [Treponema sp.]
MNTRMLFLEELNRLRHDILAMATRVEEDLGKALTALRSNDMELAGEVKASDAIVNAMQLQIEDKAAVLIATQQPVARDLRELVTIFKISGNLERAGDHTVHLAKAALKLSSEAPFRAAEHLERMAETGREMIRASIAAYLSQDAEAARRAAALDDRIDAEHKELTEAVLRLMKEHPELIKKSVRLLNTSGFLERLGDHMTNICEGIIYMTEGRHEELNNDAPGSR